MPGPSQPVDERSTDLLFSFVIPVYNVAPFLPAFLNSLAGQIPAPTDLELIFVNDGSTDESAVLIRTWIEESGISAALVEQQNQGLASARNRGLERADGAWVSFPDPDDVLDERYLAKVRNFITHQPVRPDLVSTHVMQLDDATGLTRDNHPLHRKFSRGNRLVNLEQAPEYIHLQAASAFYHRSTLLALGLRFDGSIRPNFEDAALTTLYLSSFEEPKLGIVADARYHYRRRSDGGSLVQRSWAQAEKYTTLLENGHLNILQVISDRRGSVPVWVQNTILYDLFFYFRLDEGTQGATAMVQPAWAERFHELLEEILGFIDVETVDAFSVVPTGRHLKAALIIGYYGLRTSPAAVPVVRIDADQQIVQIRYFFGGELPEEAFHADGVVVEPVYAKVRDLTYFGRVLAHERIAWLPAIAELRVRLNGHRMPLEFGTPPDPVYRADANMLWRRLTQRESAPRPPRRLGTPPAAQSPRPPVPLSKRLKPLVPRQVVRIVRAVRWRWRRLVRRGAPVVTRQGVFSGLDPRGDAKLVRSARTSQVRRAFAQAWTFIDRDTEAHDNAEHLYRYVRRHQPEVNAWFVLRRESGDWERLLAEGFRLVAFGSREHVQLLLHTRHLISSQVDHYIVQPLDVRRFGQRSWRFTFLQHGVTKDDLSRWLNPKPISRFITASVDEYESIAGDHTPYLFTDKETRLTGFPRHDRLLERRRAVERPDLIVIMPTWRRFLMNEASAGNSRDLLEPLATTLFGRSWFGLIGSRELKAIAEKAGLEIVLMPHPNMQKHFDPSDAPPWVRLCTYDRTDVQDLLAHAAVTVTDYSSQAFEAAYVECPVVYFQFDRADFFGGAHVYRQGRWSYDADGFGPVTTTCADALDAIESAATGRAPEDTYLQRMRDTFPYRDGRCCERTFRSIVALTTPLTYDQAYRPRRA